MNIAESYKLVYPNFVFTQNFIERNAIEKHQVNDIFYGLKKYLTIAFSKCERDDQYCQQWLVWFSGKQGTLLLRELFKQVDCNYWSNIYNGNVIDTLDSLQHEIVKEYNKYNGSL